MQTDNRMSRFKHDERCVLFLSSSSSVICHVVGITYQNIEHRLLAEMLGDPLGKNSDPHLMNLPDHSVMLPDSKISPWCSWKRSLSAAIETLELPPLEKINICNIIDLIPDWSCLCKWSFVCLCCCRHAGESLDEQVRLDRERRRTDLHLQPGGEREAQEHRGEDRLWEWVLLLTDE